jgi:poly(hydroxyalkanoate) granule-associated protein
MVKKLKSEVGKNQTTEWIMGFYRQIWLAGLGAFAKMENEGGKFFESLVQEGEELETRIQQSINDQFAEIKDGAGDLWSRTEQTLEALVAHTLRQLNMPTDEDVKALAKRIDKLSENIKSLSKPTVNQGYEP